VIVPTRNRRPILARAVRSALAQNEVVLEVIVVDDGSSDDTPEWLHDAALDPRVRSLRNETALGPAAARNAGLATARGRWSAFLDDDDFWAPDKLRAQLDAAAVEDAGFVYSPTIVVDEKLVPIGVDPPAPPAGRLQDLLKHNSIPGGCSSAMATTESVRAVGGFDERLRVLADWDLWLRLADVRGATTQSAAVAYVEHSGGMHVTGARATLAELATREPTGRVVVHIQKGISEWRNTAADIAVRDGDVLFVPKKAGYVMVNGQVFNPTAVSYRPGRSAKWYLSQAGGVTQLADKKAVFVIRADGSVIAAKNKPSRLPFSTKTSLSGSTTRGKWNRVDSQFATARRNGSMPLAMG
jgi:glycosyltransferase involved in cell wall biosynthesis